MKVKKFKKNLITMVELKELLKNPSPKVKVPLYTEIEVDQVITNFGDNPMKKSRLDRIEELITKLTDRMDARFNGIETRLDNVETRLDGIDTRLDGIDTRLDYIVKTNNLKDSNKV